MGKDAVVISSSLLGGLAGQLPAYTPFVAIKGNPSLRFPPALTCTRPVVALPGTVRKRIVGVQLVTAAEIVEPFVAPGNNTVPLEPKPDPLRTSGVPAGP